MEKISYQKLLVVVFALIFTFKDIRAAPIREMRDNTCQSDARQKIQKGMSATKEYINLLVGRIMITVKHIYILFYNRSAINGGSGIKLIVTIIIVLINNF